MDKLIKKKDTKQETASGVSKTKMTTIVKKESVKICSGHFKYTQSLTGNTKELVPTVNMRKKGDIIEAIEVICPCGNKIEILCQYD